ncbi:hypothetical protein PAHA111176_15770 [Parendozoicomonas haliclonae]|uniref:Uncharacterized protein n=1 Tax=Parendozoicomonas haliclonae TaxID=1960125 RepID=A0A1X7AN00_9GAMM|nr:hypothetical protein EHSB41UT_03284 [Parendozoicomonas haliclonae]
MCMARAAITKSFQRADVMSAFLYLQAGNIPDEKDKKRDILSLYKK